MADNSTAVLIVLIVIILASGGGLVFYLTKLNRRLEDDTAERKGAETKLGEDLTATKTKLAADLTAAKKGLDKEIAALTGSTNAKDAEMLKAMKQQKTDIVAMLGRLDVNDIATKQTVASLKSIGDSVKNVQAQTDINTSNHLDLISTTSAKLSSMDQSYKTMNLDIAAFKQMESRLQGNLDTTATIGDKMSRFQFDDKNATFKVCGVDSTNCKSLAFL